ncbi:O-acetylhomoserine sulfhydrylase [Bacteroidia bacterium]|nr:O-acetylhomoserine sulfhydrylase [Bacteroidia bacterium]
MKDETTILHTPYAQSDAYGALNMPIYHTAAYEFTTAAQMELAFTGRSPEHVYSRVSNPTVRYFEDRVKAIVGTPYVLAFNSGMSAITAALVVLGSAGANIVTSPHLFGNTYSLMANTLRFFGVEARFCDLTDMDEVSKHIDNHTCAVFLEVITNPQMEVVNLKTLSALCKQHGVPLIADTTIIPFTAFKAKDYGINIEIVSTTKYISGGATSLGGLLIDYNTFDWQVSPKLSPLILNNGNSAFFTKLSMEVHRNLGVFMTAETAHLQTLGLETLSLRYDRACTTCKALSERLQNVKNVVSVNYPGLKSHPYYAVSKQQFGDYPGAMFTFDLKDRAAAFQFIDRLKLIRRATNLFDNKTLAIHPASTIFGTFTEETRQQMNISQNTIRMSIGLEDVDDLFNDIAQALQ